jgi:FKBP-type peptidyl-prolyl cis-trans isomerase FklB
MKQKQTGKTISYCFAILIWLALLGVAHTDEMKEEDGAEVDMTNSLHKISYAMGYKIGDMFQNLKLAIIPDAVMQGMFDARKNIRPALTKAEMKLMLSDPKKFLAEDIDSVAQKHKKQGDLFLSANAKRPNVRVMDSGLQYSVLRKGTGKKPDRDDMVKIHYKGRNLNGHVFDDTYAKDEPSELAVYSVLPGMAEALQLMQEGAKWEIYVPSSLAYANFGPMAGQTLSFELELLEILPEKD